MAPGSAWHLEVFRIYLAIVAGVLAIAGTLLLVMGWALRKNLGPIWTTYRGWLAMLPVLVAAILLGHVGIIVLFVLLAAAGLREFFRAAGLARDCWMSGVAYGAIAALGVSALLRNYRLFMTLPL